MKRKTDCWVIVAVLMVLILPPLVVPYFAPWSEINCWHEDINLSTGRGREVRKLWFFTVWNKEFNTPLSRALDGEESPMVDSEPWRRVNTFSPGACHSPHYCYHAALNEASLFDFMAKKSKASKEKRREVAKAVLVYWQENGTDGVESCFEAFQDENSKGSR